MAITLESLLTLVSFFVSAYYFLAEFRLLGVVLLNAAYLLLVLMLLEKN